MGNTDISFEPSSSFLRDIRAATAGSQKTSTALPRCSPTWLSRRPCLQWARIALPRRLVFWFVGKDVMSVLFTMINVKLWKDVATLFPRRSYKCCQRCEHFSRQVLTFHEQGCCLKTAVIAPQGLMYLKDGIQLQLSQRTTVLLRFSSHRGRAVLTVNQPRLFLHMSSDNTRSLRPIGVILYVLSYALGSRA